MSHDMTKPAKWVRIRPVWSESSLCAQCVAKFMWTAKTLIRLGRCQADLSLRWAHIHFVFFVMRRLIYFFRSESVYLRIMTSIKVIMLQLGLTAFDFLRLLIQFIIRGNNTFDTGVWYGTVVWYGIFVQYCIPNRRTIPGFTVCPENKNNLISSGLKGICLSSKYK